MSSYQSKCSKCMTRATVDGLPFIFCIVTDNRWHSSTMIEQISKPCPLSLECFRLAVSVDKIKTFHAMQWTHHCKESNCFRKFLFSSPVGILEQQYHQFRNASMTPPASARQRRSKIVPKRSHKLQSKSAQEWQLLAIYPIAVKFIVAKTILSREKFSFPFP